MMLDPAFTWYWRVIGYASNGSVVTSIVCDDATELDAAHDTLHEHAGVTDCYTAGPFPRTRVTS